MNKLIKNNRGDKAKGLLYFMKLVKQFPHNEIYPKIVEDFRNGKKEFKNAKGEIYIIHKKR